MAGKVVGIGYSKTGTSTLKQALEILGYSATSFDGDALVEFTTTGRFERAFKLLEDVDACVDWPWPLIYPMIDARYPGSKFILTTRIDSKTWLQSCFSQVRKKPTSPYLRYIFDTEGPKGVEERWIEKYLLHNTRAETYFANRPGDLLTVCWEKGDGWSDLCDFLKCDVPDTEFPHANKSAKHAK
ncbi:MAG: sulfotransferase family protein [Pseudomonadota bacterium]